MNRVSMGEGINLSLDQELSAFVTSSLMPIVYNLLLELEKQRSIQNICFLALDLTPMIQAKPKICQNFSLQVMVFISYQMIISLLLLISSNLLTYHFSSISSISPFPCSSKEQDDSNASTLTFSLPRPHVSSPWWGGVHFKLWLGHYPRPCPVAHYPRWVGPGEEGSLDFTIDEVLALKKNGRIKSSGTFAVRMKEKGVTIVSTTMNLNGPFRSFVSARGVILDIHLNVSQRLPFFDNTYIPCMRWASGFQLRCWASSSSMCI